MPKPIKDKASREFKTFKDKVIGLYHKIKEVPLLAILMRNIFSNIFA